MKVEKITLNSERNVELTAYIQEIGGEFSNIQKRPAIVILPGGGYSMCSDREADQVAYSYLKAGFQAFILRYSVKEHAVWPNPLNDYEDAMKLIIENADQWDVYADKIAVIGFSAGGHLAACGAIISNYPPNALILGYPVLREDVKFCNKDAPEVITKIHKKMCPCFIFSTFTDSLVPIENTTKFIDALAEKNIAFECHIYSFGEHGFSTGDSSLTYGFQLCPRAKNWVEDSIEWLRECFGDFSDNCLTEPQIVNNNSIVESDILSIDCTVGDLATNPDAMSILKPIYREVMTKMDKGGPKDTTEDRDVEAMMALMKNLKIRELFTNIHVPSETIDGVDAALKNIRK